MCSEPRNMWGGDLSEHGWVLQMYLPSWILSPWGNLWRYTTTWPMSYYTWQQKPLLHHSKHTHTLISDQNTTEPVNTEQDRRGRTQSRCWSSSFLSFYAFEWVQSQIFQARTLSLFIQRGWWRDIQQTSTHSCFMLHSWKQSGTARRV